MPVVLWTDALIFLLVGVVIAFALYARPREHLRAPWRHVLQRPVAMAAAVVLAFFVFIGLADSIHFHPPIEATAGGDENRYSPQVLSLFDWFMTPVRTRVEKTYSAPLATHLFAKEAVEQADGLPGRDYPRLRYGGSHLDDPVRDRWPDLVTRTATGLVYGISLWICLGAALVFFLCTRGCTTFADQIRRIIRRQTAVPWLVILGTVGTVIALAAVAWQIAPYYHLLGTDKVGQDVFYQALKSIRTGLAIGALTTLIMLPFAVLLGITAGYFGGWVDDIIQYTYTTLNSIPSVLLIAAAVLMLQVHMASHAERFASLAVRADMRLLFLCIILGVTSWTGLCRLLRAETLKLREVDYIQAACAFGVGHFTIIVRHILPNVLHIVLITVVLDFSGLVLAEAVLSYVNIGVDPTMASWGNMINSARLEMAREPVVWWSLAAAFLFMFTLVLSANLFSDAVRDAFDPRLRTR